MNKTLYIHNARRALPWFTFPGIHFYPDRTLSLDEGQTVLSTGLEDGVARGQFAYYRSIGIGPDHIIEVPAHRFDGDLYQAVLNTPGAVRHVRRLVFDQGFKIQFFCTRMPVIGEAADLTTGFEESFIRDLGMVWDEHVLSLPSQIADIGNSKAAVRRIATSDLNGSSQFLPHKISKTGIGLVQAAWEMKKEHGRIIVKLPNWASCLGMVANPSPAELARFMWHHRSRLSDVIVEPWMGADHVAMSVLVRYENGYEVDRWHTEQLCESHEDGTISLNGNVLSPNLENVTKEDIDWLNKSADAMNARILARKSNLTGLICWDGLRDSDGERWLLEGNARETFTSYVRSMQRALSRQIGYIPTCLLYKVHPKNILSFSEIKRRLDSDLYGPIRRCGVIPMMIRCQLGAGQPYFYCVAVGKSVQHASAIMGRAKIVLEK